MQNTDRQAERKIYMQATQNEEEDIRKVERLLNRLLWLNANFSRQKAMEIFGERDAQHLHDKWVNMGQSQNTLYGGSNFLAYYSTLDMVNKHKLAVYLSYL